VAHALPSLRLQRLSLDHADERLDDVPVEMRADALAQLVERSVAIASAGIHAVGGDRGVGVGRRDDAGLDRDRVACEAVRVTVPIDALVVMTHRGRRGRDLVDAHHDALAERDVRVHELPLLVVEGTGLLEDAIGDARLADVVQPAAEVTALDRVGGKPELRGDGCRQLGDLLAVLLVDALARAREQREALRDADGLGNLALEVALGEVAHQADLVPPTPLGGVQRAIGGREQRVARDEALAALRSADRDRDRDTQALDDHRGVPHAGAHVLAELAQPRLVPRPCHQHRELLAAETRDEAALADDRRQAPTELDQHLVAGLVAVRVVDPLEAVDVEQQQAGADGGVLALESGVHRGAEPRTVGEAGQRIRRGLALGPRERDLERLGHACPLGDVREDAYEQQAPVRVRMGKDARPDVADSAVLADHAVLGLGGPARLHLCDVLAQLRLIVLVDGAPPAREHVAAGRPAEQSCDAGVDVPRAQVAVGRALELEEDVVDGLDETREPRARIAQLVGDEPALGHVETDAVDLDGVVVHARGVHPIEYPAHAAVVADDAVLELRELLRADRVGREELVEGGAVRVVHRDLPGVLGPFVRPEGTPEDALDPRPGVRLAIGIVPPEESGVQVQVERTAHLLLGLVRPAQELDERADERADSHNEQDPGTSAGELHERRPMGHEDHNRPGHDCGGRSDHRHGRLRAREGRGGEQRPRNREEPDRRALRQHDRDPVTESPLQERRGSSFEARGYQSGQQAPHPR
jgi:hypothetical protein